MKILATTVFFCCSFLALHASKQQIREKYYQVIFIKAECIVEDEENKESASRIYSYYQGLQTGLQFALDNYD